MAGTENAKIIIDISVDQKGLKKGIKESQNIIKDFVKGAGQELAGIDQSLAAGAGNPIAIGKLAADMAKKAIAALNDMAAAYREQEKAEVALQNAAKGNPYLNDNAVKQLTKFADEMQRTTGIDNTLILQTETRLASLGRNQDQIKKIMKTAADMAASGVMGFDEAVTELNNTLDGTVKTSDRLYPELKNLSKEALASGEAIDFIADKVSGAAEKAMQTGAGSVLAYKNAIGDLKKLYGEDWEKVTRGIRNAITGYIERLVAAKQATKEAKEMVEALKKEGDGASIEIKLYFDEENILKGSRELFNLRYQYEQLEKEYEDFLANSEYNSEEFNKRETERYEAELKALQGKVFARSAENNILENTILLRREIVGIEDIIQAAVSKTGQVYSLVGEDNLKMTEAYNEALKAQANLKSASAALDTEAVKDPDEFGKIVEAVKDAKQRAEAAIKIADQEELIYNSTNKAAELREEIEKSLELEIEKIERKAMLEGKNIKSLEVQRQILDAQTAAYENILSVTRDILENAPEEQTKQKAMLDSLKKQFETQRELAKTDEERKKALSDLIKLHEEVQQDADRILNLTQEQRLQDALSEIRKKSLVKAVEKEYQYRADQRNNELIDKQAQLDADYELAIQSTQLTNEEKDKLEQDYLKAKKQLTQNFADQELLIEQEKAKAIEQAHLEMYQRLLAAAQEYLNAASSIASSISTIWTNDIDYRLNEDLRANDAKIQSDEERAAAEKEIQTKAAYEKYKADLFAWGANSIMATAQAAMAVINALSQPPGPPATIPMSILAGAMGAMQVAAVISAKPKPPRFHTGGIVQGRSGQEVNATLMAGEKITTQKQFGNIMQAFANMANSKMSGGQPEMNVKVENTASNMVSATPTMTADGLKIVVEQIVQDSLSSGRMDQALTKQQSNQRGISLL
jgi:hypothetical protein